MHPISVSKAVLEKTSHALLVGQGAEDFAKEQGFSLIDSSQLTSPRALELLNKILKNQTAATTEIPQYIQKPFFNGYHLLPQFPPLLRLICGWVQIPDFFEISCPGYPVVKEVPWAQLR